MVVFGVIGIDTKKLHSCGDKREIHIAEHLTVDLISSTEKVVIADKDNIGFDKSPKIIARPYILLDSASVGEVAEMNHEVDTVPAVDVAHHIAEVGIVVMAVAYECHAQGVEIAALLFNLYDIVVVDVSFSVKPHLIGMVLK